ncbi:MAG: universal stress protein [Bacillota bacterium]
MFQDKLLLATDFSESANKLINCLDEFKVLGLNSVYLLHVVETRRGGVSIDVLEKYKEMMEETREVVEARGLEVEYDVVVGKPSDEITRAAKEQNCSMILIASHGQSIIKQIILGSTTYKVLRKSDVPVFIERYEKGKGKEKKPVCQIKFSRVVIPIDCTECSNVMIDNILSLDHTLQRVILVNSVERSFNEEEMLIKKSEAAEDLAVYRQKLEESSFIKDVKVVIDTGTASDLILKTAAEEQATLIMMPTLGVHHLEELKIGSTADRIVRKADLPLLMVPCDPVLNKNLHRDMMGEG